MGKELSFEIIKEESQKIPSLVEKIEFIQDKTIELEQQNYKYSEIGNDNPYKKDLNMCSLETGRISREIEKKLKQFIFDPEDFFKSNVPNIEKEIFTWLELLVETGPEFTIPLYWKRRIFELKQAQLKLPNPIHVDDIHKMTASDTIYTLIKLCELEIDKCNLYEPSSSGSSIGDIEDGIIDPEDLSMPSTENRAISEHLPNSNKIGWDKSTRLLIRFFKECQRRGFFKEVPNPWATIASSFTDKNGKPINANFLASEWNTMNRHTYTGPKGKERVDKLLDYTDDNIPEN